MVIEGTKEELRIRNHFIVLEFRVKKLGQYENMLVLEKVERKKCWMIIKFMIPWVVPYHDNHTYMSMN